VSKAWPFGQLANGIHAGIVVELGSSCSMSKWAKVPRAPHRWLDLLAGGFGVSSMGNPFD
jgi:hypothetical protein